MSYHYHAYTGSVKGVEANPPKAMSPLGHHLPNPAAADDCKSLAL